MYAIRSYYELRSAATLLVHSRLLFSDVYAALTPVPWDDDLQAVIDHFSWLDDALVLQRMQLEYKQMLKNAPCQKELNEMVEHSNAKLPNFSETKTFLLSPMYCGVMLKLSKWLATHKVVQPGSTAPDSYNFV